MVKNILKIDEIHIDRKFWLTKKQLVKVAFGIKKKLFYEISLSSFREFLRL